MNKGPFGQMQKVKFDDDRKTATSDFDLGAFFPYLVRVFYLSVRDSVAGIYQKTYDLTIPEWRTLCVIGPDRSLAAVEIVEFSSLDKVAVSRAVASMRKKGYLIKSIDGDDRRRSALKLSAKGQEVFFDLVPQMKALEKDMFTGFSQQERADFQDMMLRIRKNIENHEQR